MATICGEAIRTTRHKHIGYWRAAPGLWRLVFIDDDYAAEVGAHYRTKAELLADLERYAGENGHI